MLRSIKVLTGLNSHAVAERSCVTRADSCDHQLLGEGIAVSNHVLSLHISQTHYGAGEQESF